MTTLAGLVTVAALLLAAPGQARGRAVAAPTSRSKEALRLLSDIVSGRDQAVVATFNPTMARQLSSARLATAWATYQSVFGRYRGHGRPFAVTVGSLIVVRIPLRMSRRPGEFRITFQADGRVAGLYFLRTGVPL